MNQTNTIIGEMVGGVVGDLGWWDHGWWMGLIIH